MKQEVKDQQLRQKLDALDTLSAGMVYGKEDAWEKLQARIEHKPARRIAFPWRLAAAAAVLLLFAGSTAILYTAPQHIAKIGIKQQDIPQVAGRPVTQPAEKPAQENKINKPPVIAVTTGHNTLHKTTVITSNSIIIAPIPTVENKPPVVVVPKELPAPATAITAPIKVYYIGDVEKNAAVVPQGTAYAAAAPDAGKLPVVHIQELERQEREVKNILHENRMSASKYLFFKPVYNRDDAAQEYNGHRNSIRSILNQQN